MLWTKSFFYVFLKSFVSPWLQMNLICFNFFISKYERSPKLNRRWKRARSHEMAKHEFQIHLPLFGNQFPAHWGTHRHKLAAAHQNRGATKQTRKLAHLAQPDTFFCWRMLFWRLKSPSARVKFAYFVVSMNTFFVCCCFFFVRGAIFITNLLSAVGLLNS